MAKFLLTILLCYVALAASVGDQVKHLLINQANLIETMQGFAMNAPILEQNNIKTVSVNGNQVTITAPNCQQTQLTKQQLASMQDYQNILTSTKMQLNSVESGQPQQMAQYTTRSGSVTYSLNDQVTASMSYGRNMNMHSFNSNGVAMTKFDDNNMSMKRPNMPNNINRVFLTQDVVTFVYNNGQVQMKPAACLQAAEQQFVQQMRNDIQQAQIQFNQNMRQFHNNMNHNMQNLQQNLQNMQLSMQQNMQGMFSNPFGNRFNPNFNSMMNQYQMMPGQASQMQTQNGNVASASAITGGFPTQAYAGATSGGIDFGSNFPFGPNNNPFGQGFPFNG